MIRTIFILLLMILVFCGIGILMLYTGYLRFNYPSRSAYPIRGIDISHHQGRIDWVELSKENLDFVFIKSTEGGDFVDTLFRSNWESAQASGYKIGAYHFYRLCKSGEEQARNIIKTVPIGGELGPVLDLEFGANCSTAQSKEEVREEIKTCLSLLEEHYNSSPILYVTREFYETYVKNEFSGYSLWIRSIYGKPSIEEEWDYWQYGNRGHLRGISGYVDLNVYRGQKWEDVKVENITN